jgi:hypothetical protein
VVTIFVAMVLDIVYQQIALEGSTHISLMSESYPDIIFLACGGVTDLLLRR